MITKMLIVALCILAGTMTGLIFSKKLKNRANYYKSAAAFVDTLITEVSFKKSTIKKIMNDFLVSNNSAFNNDINEYLSCADKNSLILKKGVLNESECYEMKKFFQSLGQSDAQTQITELENYKKLFGKFYSEAEEKMKKNGGMYIKLGFFAGLALGIILL